MSSTSPGNDFRFGAEAPSATVPTYIGNNFTHIEAFLNGEVAASAPCKKTLGFGVKDTPPVQVATEDRNRSPLPLRRRPV